MPLMIECDRTWSGIGIDNGWPHFWGFRFGWLAFHWLDHDAIRALGRTDPAEWPNGTRRELKEEA